MAGPDSKIGTVRIDAEVDVSKAEEQLESLKQTAEETGDKIVESTDNASEGFGKFGKDVENSTEQASGSFSKMTEKLQSDVSRQVGAITGLIGSVTAVVGVFTLFYNIGTKISGMLFDQRTQVEKLQDELDKLPASYQRQSLAQSKSLAESIRAASAESDILRQRIAGLETGQNEYNLTLEQALERRKQIEDDYNTQAAVYSASWSSRLFGYTADFDRIFELRASREEKQLLGRINKITQAYSDAKDRLEQIEREEAEAADQALKDVAAAKFRSELEKFMAEADAKREATLAELNARNRAIEDQLLGPLEAQERSLVERLAELNQLLRSSTDGEIKDAATRQIELLEEVLGNLRAQSKQSNDTVKILQELPSNIENSMDRALNRFGESVGILRIQRTLDAIYQDSESIAAEIASRPL